MRLVRVELTRLLWRRAVLLLVAAGVVLSALVWGMTAWDTRPFSEAEVAQAEQQAAAERASEWVQDALAECTEDPPTWGLPAGATEAECEGAVLPSAESYLWRQQLDLRLETRESGVGVVAVLAALLLLAGTTFVGHDWNTGSLSNQLLFEPRRVPVWLGKAAAVLLLGVLVPAVVLTLYWSGMVGLAAQRDLPHGPAVVTDLAWFVVRGTLLCAGAAVVGYALTMLFRSTVATLGAVFLVAVAGSFLLGVLGGTEGYRWTVTTNALAFLQDGHEYWVDDPTCQDVVDLEECGRRVLTAVQGATFLGLLLAGSVAASLWSFRRRDLP